MTASLIGSISPKVYSSPASKAVLIAIGVAILTASAKIEVPFWPVPMTMQTAVVLFFGAALGWRMAGSTVLAYLALGAAGLPVFAKGGGLAYLAGPTGGYLVGFLAGAVLVGWLAQNGWGRALPKVIAAMIAGDVVIFALGAGWLSGFVGFEKAIDLGIVPFLLAEFCKIALAAAVLVVAWRAHRETGSA